MGSGTREKLGRVRPLAAAVSVIAVVGVSAMSISGCAQRSDGKRDGAPPASRTTSVHHKPQAPVNLELTSLPSAAGHWVTAVASPTVDTPLLQVTIFGPGIQESRTFKNVPAGSPRTFRVPIRVGGAWIRASARLHLRNGRNGFAPNRVAEIAVGTPPAKRQAKTREIALPTGERIDEVRR